VVNERDPDPSTVDWLDLGPDHDLGGPRHAGGWRWWYLLVAAMVLAALLLTRNQRVAPRLTGSDPAGSTQAGSLSAARTLPEPHSPPRHTGSVTVTEAGRPLLAVPADWELFGQGPGVIVRMELGRGRVTRTSVPDLGSAGPIFFVVGSDRVIVHPMDFVAGYVVYDGKLATQLPPALDQADSVLPGPDPRHVWAETQAGTASALSLLTVDGSPAGIQIPIPPDATVQASDRAGYALMFGIGGMYDARPDGLHRVTGGTLLAVGPTRWLTVECDERYHCASIVTDRRDGARQVLRTPLDAYEQNSGAISPDGRIAALLQHNGAGATNVHLLNLVTGADLVTGVRTDSDQTVGGRTFVWSPDSRWLFVTTGTGRVLAINRTGRATALDLRVGPIHQLALRSRTR
jgi:hypothetical protein